MAHEPSSEEGPWSPREERLWCELARARMHLEQRDKDLALLRELVDLQRTLLAAPAAPPPVPAGKPALVVPLVSKRRLNKSHPIKTCDRPACEEVVNVGQRYCSQSCNLKHRWETGRMRNRKKPTLSKGA